MMMMVQNGMLLLDGDNNDVLFISEPSTVDSG